MVREAQASLNFCPQGKIVMVNDLMTIKSAFMHSKHNSALRKLLLYISHHVSFWFHSMKKLIVVYALHHPPIKKIHNPFVLKGFLFIQSAYHSS
jgi:hypothetical protein